MLLALVGFFVYTFASAGKGIYDSYRRREEKREILRRFYASLSTLGYRRLEAEERRPATQDYLDRYYVLRSRTLPTLELKATTAFTATVRSVPACLMMVYEKVDVFGAPIGAGRTGPRSEYEGTVAAARMPLSVGGRTMIYRRPATEDDDPWDWLGEKPLLGARARPIEAGLREDFRREFAVKSTDRAASLPGPLQELLLENAPLFADPDSALVLDESGWGYASPIISDEDQLNRLVSFQAALIERLSGPGRRHLAQSR